MKKEYVVVWNQKNSMGLPMLPMGKSSVRVSAENENDAKEDAMMTIMQIISFQIENIQCEGRVSDDGNFYIEISSLYDRTPLGKVYDFVAMEADR